MGQIFVAFSEYLNFHTVSHGSDGLSSYLAKLRYSEKAQKNWLTIFMTLLNSVQSYVEDGPNLIFK